jgi:hypothetical protein
MVSTDCFPNSSLDGSLGIVDSSRLAFVISLNFQQSGATIKVDRKGGYDTEFRAKIEPHSKREDKTNKNNGVDGSCSFAFPSAPLFFSHL